MKKEELLAIGLNEEQIKEVFKINGQDIANVRQTQVDLEADKIALEDRIKELEGNVEDAIKPEDYEAIKASNSSLEEELNQLRGTHLEEINNIKFDNLLSLELVKSKARSLKAVRAELDLSEVKYEDGKLVGIDEALGRVKEEHNYLFEPEADNNPGLPKYTRRTSDSENPKLTKDQFTKMTYTEKLNLFKKDPVLYKQFTR